MEVGGERIVLLEVLLNSQPISPRLCLTFRDDDFFVGQPSQMATDRLACDMEFGDSAGCNVSISAGGNFPYEPLPYLWCVSHKRL